MEKLRRQSEKDVVLEGTRLRKRTKRLPLRKIWLLLEGSLLSSGRQRSRSRSQKEITRTRDRRCSWHGRSTVLLCIRGCLLWRSRGSWHSIAGYEMRGAARGTLRLFWQDDFLYWSSSTGGNRKLSSRKERSVRPYGLTQSLLLNFACEFDNEGIDLYVRLLDNDSDEDGWRCHDLVGNDVPSPEGEEGSDAGTLATWNEKTDITCGW